MEISLTVILKLSTQFQITLKICYIFLMKILFITDLYPISSSNEPITLVNFVNKWKQSGHSIDIIRPNFLLNTILRRKKIHANDVYIENGIKIFNLNFITPFLFNIKNKLPKDFDINNYDIVISHMPSGSLFASKLVKNSNIPFICAVHTSDIEVMTNPIYKLYFSPELKKAYKKAHMIATRSFVLERKIKSLIPESKQKTFVAYSGIEKEYIENEEFFINKLNHFTNTQELKITSTSSLIKRKNIDIVLKALSKLEFTNWQYTIIGSGKELNRLKRLSEKLKIDEKVIFLNNIPREKVLDILKESDIFILLSEKETFGMAYLEAMAKANIIIGTKNDGIDGILQDKVNGFTCNPNIKELTNVINKIKNTPSEKLKEIYLNCHKTISEYTDDIAAKNYIENIKKAIKIK